VGGRPPAPLRGGWPAPLRGGWPAAGRLAGTPPRRLAGTPPRRGFAAGAASAPPRARRERGGHGVDLRK